MKQALTVSIITPSFNQKRFITKTIESVLTQSTEQLEYIVMDGGSTDGTVEILKRYEKIIKKYNKKISFHWVSEKDKGQADAINKGLRRATGDIVTYINSDDYYFPNTITDIVNFFAAHPEAMWVTGDCRIVDEKGKEIQKCVRWYKKFFRLFSTKIILPILNPIAQPSTFCRREAVEKVGFFDENLRYAFDYDYWIRMIKRYPLFVIGKLVAAFRIHKASKGGISYRQQFEEETKITKKYINNRIMVKLHILHSALIVKIYSLIK